MARRSSSSSSSERDGTPIASPKEPLQRLLRQPSTPSTPIPPARPKFPLGEIGDRRQFTFSPGAVDAGGTPARIRGPSFISPVKVRQTVARQVVSLTKKLKPAGVRRLATVTNELQRGKFVSNRTFAFQSPENVLVCVRRKVRREVLHAMHPLKLGRGGGGSRKRRGPFSDIRC